jgi:hypothetical protein
LSGFALWGISNCTSPWVEQGLESGLLMRDGRWTESIAVGSLAFIDQAKNELGFKAAHRDVVEADGSCALREPDEAYGLKFAVKVRL